MYWFDATNRCAGLPARGTLPWPVEFIAQECSRKHVFGSRGIFAIDVLSKCVSQWVFKTKWRLWFDSRSGGSDGEPSQNYRHLYSKTEARYCPHAFDDRIEGFLNCAAERMHAAGMRAVAIARRDKRNHSAPKFLKLVDRTMEIYGLHLIPTDKDGGSAVVETHGLRVAVSNLFGNEAWYKQTVVYDFTNSWEDYHTAATAVSLGNMPLRRALFSDSRNSLDRICAKLSYTCKTHKPDGQVVLRPIHSFLQSPMAPGMR